MEDFAKRILNSFYGVDKSLDAQLSACKVLRIEHTVVGMYIYLEIPILKKLSLKKILLDYNPIDGPDLINPEGTSFGQCILFTNKGYVNFIEIYTYTKNLPTTKEELLKIKLSSEVK